MKEVMHGALSFSKRKSYFDTLQESLQNNCKHAQANKADVLLSYQSEHVLLRLRIMELAFHYLSLWLKQRMSHIMVYYI